MARRTRQEPNVPAPGMPPMPGGELRRGIRFPGPGGKSGATAEQSIPHNAYPAQNKSFILQFFPEKPAPVKPPLSCIAESPRCLSIKVPEGFNEVSGIDETTLFSDFINREMIFPDQLQSQFHPHGFQRCIEILFIVATEQF